MYFLKISLPNGIVFTIGDQRLFKKEF